MMATATIVSFHAELTVAVGRVVSGNSPVLEVRTGLLEEMATLRAVMTVGPDVSAGYGWFSVRGPASKRP
jgi:hypothetical protein